MVSAFCCHGSGAIAMTRMPIIESETGRTVGHKDVPDEILAAAEKVEAWLQKQASGFVLHGVQLADC